MQAYHRRRIIGFCAIAGVAIALGCAHSRPVYTEELREVHTSPGVRVRAPFVDVQVPVTSKRDQDKDRDDDDRDEKRRDD